MEAHQFQFPGLWRWFSGEQEPVAAGSPPGRREEEEEEEKTLRMEGKKKKVKKNNQARPRWRPPAEEHRFRVALGFQRRLPAARLSSQLQVVVFSKSFFLLFYCFCLEEA